MAKEKACKQCKTVVESGSKCPKCGSKELADSYKGKVAIMNGEGEIATNLELKEKGVYAVRVG
tara:strand:+ start:3559 stop:3747 length:189 start_codon:yes stop_codon:yes gene_type:complete